MFRRSLSVALVSLMLITFSFSFSSCGGGSNAVSVCKTAISALFDLCDTTTDVTTIQNIFASFGIYDVTPLEIQTTSESEVKADLCVLDEGEDDINDTLKDLIEDEIKDANSCSDLETIADTYGYLFI